ncbi:hypothetical protein [Dankookia sp. P2]|uniref:hypothetical protein n=1 Tax=Dankookia sp. P2 TaxID=3423955 RepID=UPI003D6752FA
MIVADAPARPQREREKSAASIDVLSPPSAMLARHFARDPSLLPRYDRLRRLAGGIVGSNYDVSDVCNLRCEGCLYFEGSDRAGHKDSEADNAWNALFAAEKARGVNFAYLAGAEPALQRARLRMAARHIGRGVVFTNGTVSIDPDLPFAIHVSIWGDQASTPALRGAGSYDRAFRLFGKDPRARFIMTVNALNIETTWTVAERCAAEGARLSFSLFSPTMQYRGKLEAQAGNDDATFRISTPDRHLAPTPADLLRIRDTLDAVSARYPGTVLYKGAYNRWVTDPAGLYRIDPVTGWATDCGTRNTGRHRHVRVDLTTSQSKCCSPNLDCRDCRSYAMAAGTAVSRFRRFATTFEGFRDWIEISEGWAALFLRDWPLESSATGAS